VQVAGGRSSAPCRLPSPGTIVGVCPPAGARILLPAAPFAGSATVVLPRVQRPLAVLSAAPARRRGFVLVTRTTSRALVPTAASPRRGSVVQVVPVVVPAPVDVVGGGGGCYTIPDQCASFSRQSKQAPRASGKTHDEEKRRAACGFRNEEAEAEEEAEEPPRCSSWPRDRWW
jgi:hypothetical protein